MISTAEIMKRAKAARTSIALADCRRKNEALLNAADEILKNADEIITANKLDTEDAKGKISDVMLDRLMLNRERIESMANGIREVALLDDPVGVTLDTVERPGGLTVRKVSVPLGVVAIIYESRPNVTSDAAVLSLKSGNACILRSGKEAHRSAAAITEAIKAGIEKSGISPDAVMLVEDTTRNSAVELMKGVGYIDLLIPRGGKGLIKSCVENADVPCIETGTGICHIYVDRDADIKKALDIIENAKTSRPSVCNAAEVCVVHKDIAPVFIPEMEKRLCEERRLASLPPVILKCDSEALGYTKSGIPAGENDFDTEFLDYILAVKTVDNIDAAVRHISAHSTGHSDAIVTENKDSAAYFTDNTDSAAVYVNASTRFTDGGEFGLGCEMGISTQKLHARGPMGLRELTTYKYIITGNGNIRK